METSADNDRVLEDQGVVYLVGSDSKRIDRDRYSRIYMRDEIEMGHVGIGNDVELSGVTNPIIENLAINDQRTQPIPKESWGRQIHVSSLVKKARSDFSKDNRAHWPRPCTMPARLLPPTKPGEEERDLNTLWMKDVCFCHASMRGFAAADTVTHLDKLTQPLLPLYNIIQDGKKANSTKNAFCMFHRALVPVYEKNDIWKHYYFVLKGDDVRPLATEKRHNGIGRLCRHGLAMLLGVWTNQAGMTRHDETAFSLQFYHSCIEPDETKCKPKLENSVSVATWYQRSYKDTLLRNLILELAILCLIENDGYVPSGDLYMPRSPPKDDVYFHWYEGKLLPVTKSIPLSYPTFDKTYSNVLEVLGIEGNNQAHSVQIADHRLRYVYPNLEEPANSCVNVESWRHYLGEMPNDDKTPTANVQVVKVDRKFLLQQLTVQWEKDTKADILPKRDKKAFGVELQPYHEGSETFYQASDRREEHAWATLFSTEETRNKATDAIVQLLQSTDLSSFMDDSLLDDQVYYRNFGVDFRQCRFSTKFHERVAPHLEFSTEIREKLAAHGCRIVTFIIPVQEMGVWVRLFLNKHDRHGVLIKVMHGSALMYESTVMPIELGRCTHHEGNPYFAFHMLLSQKQDMPDAAKILEENVLHDKMGKCREYIHFPNTFEAQGEKGMRIVTPNQNVWPQEKTEWNAWQQWDSPSSKRLEEMCAC